MNRSKRSGRTTPACVLLEYLQLVEPTVLSLLFSDIVLHLLFIPPHRRHLVPSGPKVQPHKVLLAVHEPSRDRTFPLMYPTTPDTEYFGGIISIMWT